MTRVSGARIIRSPARLKRISSNCNTPSNHHVRFRASFEKAIRAPSLIELFNPQLPRNLHDRERSMRTGREHRGGQATLAQCLNTVPASERAAFTAAYGNGGSTNIIPQTVDDQGYLVEGGNPTLKPEIGKTWTVGASFTPTFVPGLTGSIDYFHILLTNEIGVASAEGSPIWMFGPRGCRILQPSRPQLRHLQLQWTDVGNRRLHPGRQKSHRRRIIQRYRYSAELPAGSARRSWSLYRRLERHLYQALRQAVSRLAVLLITRRRR